MPHVVWRVAFGRMFERTALPDGPRVISARLPAESVHCVVTSPPYWGLRDYGTPGQLGLEATPEELE